MKGDYRFTVGVGNGTGTEQLVADFNSQFSILMWKSE